MFEHCALVADTLLRALTLGWKLVVVMVVAVIVTAAVMVVIVW